MKNYSYTCGVLGRNILALMGAGIFISAYIERRNSFGSPIPNDFCTVRSEIVPSKTGDSAALFPCPYYNFSFMEGTMKNCGTGNNSTRTATPRRAKPASLSRLTKVELLSLLREERRQATAEAHTLHSTIDLQVNRISVRDSIIESLQKRNQLLYDCHKTMYDAYKSLYDYTKTRDILNKIV